MLLISFTVYACCQLVRWFEISVRNDHFIHPRLVERVGINQVVCRTIGHGASNRRWLQQIHEGDMLVEVSTKLPGDRRRWIDRRDRRKPVHKAEESCRSHYSWAMGVQRDLSWDQRGFVVLVPDRRAPTLVAIIQDRILYGSTIISDSWHAYNGVRDLNINAWTIGITLCFVVYLILIECLI